MSERVYLAVDLGAESGRVIAGKLAKGRVSLEEVHRFPNGPVNMAGDASLGRVAVVVRYSGRADAGSSQVWRQHRLGRRRYLGGRLRAALQERRGARPALQLPRPAHATGCSSTRCRWCPRRRSSPRPACSSWRSTRCIRSSRCSCRIRS